MNIRGRLKTSVLGLVGLYLVTGCGAWFQSKTSTGRGSSYVSNARIEALKLAATRPTIHKGMKLAESCDAVTADLNESLRQQWIQQKASISDSMAYMLNRENDVRSDAKADGISSSANTSSDSAAPSEASTASADTMTNVQEAGVDEADRYRVGRDQIYSVGFGKLQVIDRASLQLQGTLDVSSYYNPQMLTRDDRLIVVGSAPSTDPNPIAQATKLTSPASAPSVSTMPSPGGYGYTSDVQIAIYRTAAGQMPVLLKQQKIKGSYVDIRLIKNQIVLVLQDQLQGETVPVVFEDFSDEDWYKDPRAKQYFQSYAQYYQRVNEIKAVEESLNGIPCNQIVSRKVSDWDFGFSKIFSMDIQNIESPVKSLGVIGQGDQIYMTTNSLYLLKSQRHWFDTMWGAVDWYGSSDETLLIQQIGFDGTTGSLTPLAEGEVRGRIKDRWSLHAMNEGQNLIVATSTGILWASDGPSVAQNHLYSLELNEAAQQLNVVGSVENFGTHEDIRSVRYVGSIAYVVTFKKTDPLFAFDIANPKAPKLLSGLKVPGFSTYMHPLADGRVLGVGFDALDMGDFAWYQGIQVSLFDTSNPLEMSRLDNKIYGSRGSSSEVTFDPHAFFYDASSGLIGLPLVEIIAKDMYSQSYLQFSGAQILGFEGNVLGERGRVSHSEWIPAACKQQMAYRQWWQNGTSSLDINRLYRVDNRLITLSPFGLKAFGLTDLSAAQVSLPFKFTNPQCDSNQPIPL